MKVITIILWCFSKSYVFSYPYYVGENGVFICIHFGERIPTHFGVDGKTKKKKRKTLFKFTLVVVNWASGVFVIRSTPWHLSSKRNLN